MEEQTSVGIVVFRKEGLSWLYLLLQYGKGHWGLVKGHQERGETERQTGLREAQEETGLTDLQFLDGFRQTMRYFFREKGKLIRKEVIYYLARTSSAPIALSSEHIAFTWLPYAEALQQITFKSDKETLEQAEQFLQNSLHSFLSSEP